MTRFFILIFTIFIYSSISISYSQQYIEDDIVEFTSPSNNTDRLTDNNVQSYLYSSEVAFEIPISALKTLTVRFYTGYAKDAELYLSTTPIDSSDLSSLVSYSSQESSYSHLTFNLNDIQTKYILIKTLDNSHTFFSEVELLSIPPASPPSIKIDETLVHSPNDGVNTVISTIEISDPNGDEISNITTESDYYSLNASNTALIISQTPPPGKNEIIITATANGDTTSKTITILNFTELQEFPTYNITRDYYYDYPASNLYDDDLNTNLYFSKLSGSFSFSFEAHGIYIDWTHDGGTLDVYFYDNNISDFTSLTPDLVIPYEEAGYYYLDSPKSAKHIHIEKTPGSSSYANNKIKELKILGDVDETPKLSVIDKISNQNIEQGNLIFNTALTQSLTLASLDIIDLQNDQITYTLSTTLTNGSPNFELVEVSSTNNGSKKTIELRSLINFKGVKKFENQITISDSKGNTSSKTIEIYIAKQFEGFGKYAIEGYDSAEPASKMFDEETSTNILFRKLDVVFPFKPSIDGIYIDWTHDGGTLDVYFSENPISDYSLVSADLTIPYEKPGYYFLGSSKSTKYIHIEKTPGSANYNNNKIKEIKFIGDVSEAAFTEVKNLISDNNKIYYEGQSIDANTDILIASFTDLQSDTLSYEFISSQSDGVNDDFEIISSSVSKTTLGVSSHSKLDLTIKSKKSLIPGTYSSTIKVIESGGNNETQKQIIVNIVEDFDDINITEYLTASVFTEEFGKSIYTDGISSTLINGDIINFVFPEEATIQRIDFKAKQGNNLLKTLSPLIYSFETKPTEAATFENPIYVTSSVSSISHSVYFDKGELSAKTFAFKYDNLKIEEITFYGSLPETPFYTDYRSTFSAVVSSTVNSVIANLEIGDYQNDILSFQLNDSEFDIITNSQSSTYDLIVNTNSLTTGTHSITLSITDSKNNTLTKSITIEVFGMDPVDKALSTGKYFFASLDQLLNEAIYITSNNAIESLNVSTTLTSEQYDGVKFVLDGLKSKVWNLDFSNHILEGGGSDGVKVEQQFRLDVENVGNWDKVEGAGEYFRKFTNDLDKNKNKTFESSINQNRLEKILILIGDHIRQNIVYPLDATSNDDTKKTNFLSAFLADRLVYNYRDYAPQQKDLGTFSRSDFSHITTTNKTVSLKSRPRALFPRPSSSFKSAGVYALPGQTFTITRNDSYSDEKTYVFVNTLRHKTTYDLFRNAYARPKYLRSQRIEIEPGETVEFTSVYGGPVQIQFEHVNSLNSDYSSNTQTGNNDVEFLFQNIGLHPHWRNSSDSATFVEQLKAYEYDWAEFVSKNGMEIHSLLPRMIKTLQWHQKSYLLKMETNADYQLSSDNILDSSDPERLDDITFKTMKTFPFVLAGDKIPVTGEYENTDFNVDAINNWASEKGLDQTVHNEQWHMNADLPSCGFGCSGNPWDALWEFNPLGHGDIHELGHSLEFKFFPRDAVTHSQTNYYSYYSQSRFNLENELGLEVQSQFGFNWENVFKKKSLTNQPPPCKHKVLSALSWTNNLSTFFTFVKS